MFCAKFVEIGPLVLEVTIFVNDQCMFASGGFCVFYSCFDGFCVFCSCSDSLYAFNNFRCFLCFTPAQMFSVRFTVVQMVSLCFNPVQMFSVC
mgnify:CR=1 FL=1